MKVFTLYGLKNSDGNVRYIGITSLSLKKRLSGHLRERFQANPHKHRWFSQSKGNMEIIPYAVGLSEDEAYVLEVSVIKDLRDRGFDLVNISNGGEAPMFGRKSSLHTREKLKNLWTPERRKAFSVLKTGVKVGPHSLEWNQKISKGNLGKKTPVEVRRKISETLTGKKTGRNKSGFVGVSKVGKYWQAAITISRKTKCVGYFLDLQSAVKAREIALEKQKERIE